MKKKRVLAIFMAIVMVFCYIPVTSFADATTLSDSAFMDMPSEGFWSTQALNAAVNNGLINGFTEKDGTYIKPNDPLTRAQIATIVNRAFGANDIASLSGNSDVPVSAWYYKDMQKSVKMGTMKLDTNMRPNDNITRQEAFTILGRALKMDNGSKNDIASFNDASQVADWAAPAMGAMVKAGYIKGDNNLLNPKAKMTRAQFAVVMDNAIKQYITKPGTVTEVASGNIMINVAGVTLENVTIRGDLIIGDGIGNGTVNLNNAKIIGRLVVRGERIDSVIVSGDTIIEEDPIGEKENPLIHGKIVATEINAGQTLAESTLSGTFKNSLGEVVDGKLSWATPKTIVAETGGFAWIFTPTDTTIYNVITGTVTVTAIATIVLTPITPIAEFAGGNGTISDPYKVANTKQLDNVRNYLDKNFIQTADIDLSYTPGDTDGGWNPIGNESKQFTGSYNGDVYKIIGLTMAKPSGKCLGLFGATGSNAKLINIGLIDVRINGKEVVGGLVGRNYGTIERCYVSSDFIYVNNSVVGGLVGQNEGTISKSYASIMVEGKDGVGGLAGRNYGTINNSYATGSVKGSGIFIGGLVGWNKDAIIDSCYSSGLVTGITGDIGGLTGKSSGTIKNSYYDSVIAEQSDTGKGEGKLSAHMTTKSNFVDWDFENTWAIKTKPGSYPYLQWQTGNIPYIPSGFAGGSGTEEDPYQVANAKQLNNVRNHLNKHFIQTAAIDLGVAPWNTGYGWFSIGQYYSGSFSGSYNGDNYYIYGLTINSAPETGWAGLFGDVNESAKLSNIALMNVKISGESYVGALVSSNQGNIDSCYVTGSIKGKKDVGGLVGYNYGTIERSYSTAAVTGGFGFTGGLVGLNRIEGIIKNCDASGHVIGVDNVGGLVGLNYGTLDNNFSKGSVTGNEFVGGLVGDNIGNINGCYATGAVTGTSNHIGGLAGRGNRVLGPTGGKWSVISECYATGSVTGVDTVGGLVGFDYGEIEKCYATGSVKGCNKIGGLAGEKCRMGSRYSLISECFAMGSVTGLDKVGGLVGYSECILKNTYATGSVTGVNYIGGLVGYGDLNSFIDYSYATGLVKATNTSGKTYVAGIIGYNGGNTTKCYYDKETTKCSDTGKGAPKKTAEMNTEKTFDTWDFNDIWSIQTSPSSYPYLKWQGKKIFQLLNYK